MTAAECSRARLAIWICLGRRRLQLCPGISLAPWTATTGLFRYQLSGLVNFCRKVPNRSKSTAVMLAPFKLGHYLADRCCYENLTTRREARQQMQWTFRSSIAMKQMGETKKSQRPFNTQCHDSSSKSQSERRYQVYEKPSISEQQRCYSNVHVVLKYHYMTNPSSCSSPKIPPSTSPSTSPPSSPPSPPKPSSQPASPQVSYATPNTRETPSSSPPPQTPRPSKTPT